MSLCRHYVRELRRSVLVGTPEMSKRSSDALDQLAAANDPLIAGPSTSAAYEKSAIRESDAETSAFLRDAANNSLVTATAAQHESPQSSVGRSGEARSSGPRDLNTDSNSPAHTVARQDIRASAEKILYTFLLPGAEREIVLPGSITQDVTAAIEEFGRDDPEVFDVAKDYVFQAMERDAFPPFLKMKALGNLIPPTLMLRLGIGLLSIFGAFWTGFILIFLNRERLTRCWVCVVKFCRFSISLSLFPLFPTPQKLTLYDQVILPFTLGTYCLGAYQYTMDPILALVGLSEYTPFNFSRIREPYVRRLLVKRAAFALAVILTLDAALCCLFIFVPGMRL